MSPVPEYQLISIHIIEKFNNNKLITWTYPCITENIKQVLLQRAFQENGSFKFHRSAYNEWIFLWERCNEVKTYTLALITKCFDPDKFQHFGDALCKAYEKQYNPVYLVKLYLGAFNSGCYVVQANGSNVKKEFKTLEKTCDIKDLIKLFDLEIILIYNALLLKKRVLVFHSNFVYLQKNLLMMSYLLDRKLRDATQYLFPVIKNINVELKGKHFFVAGITDLSSSTKQESFDLFVNLEAKSIEISNFSKEIFTMTKIHKELAKLMVQLTVQDCENEKLLLQVHEKTDDILENLRSLAVVRTPENKPVITLEELRSRKLTRVMENFLFNLAIAENIMML